MYENHRKALTEFANSQINGLMDADPVSPDEFAIHLQGFCQQNFVDTEFIYESGMISDGKLLEWSNPAYVPVAVARNYLLIALYEVLLECMESDASQESSRLLTLREMLEVMV